MWTKEVVDEVVDLLHVDLLGRLLGLRLLLGRGCRNLNGGLNLFGLRASPRYLLRDKRALKKVGQSDRASPRLRLRTRLSADNLRSGRRLKDLTDRGTGTFLLDKRGAATSDQLAATGLLPGLLGSAPLTLRNGQPNEVSHDAVVAARSRFDWLLGPIPSHIQAKRLGHSLEGTPIAPLAPKQSSGLKLPVEEMTMGQTIAAAA